MEEKNGIKTIHDIANHSLGIIVTDRQGIKKNVIILPKGCIIPCSKSYTYTKRQTIINITQGEGEDPDFVGVIATQIPPNISTEQPLELILQYDANQRIHCIFKDVASGRIEEIDIYLDDKTSATTVDSFIVE